uniref:Uncharacterized protein n=1 Tax=Arundo donax TaxID=35708 RepID=A0A0A9CIR8_ARUDO
MNARMGVFGSSLESWLTPPRLVHLPRPAR